VSLYFCSRKMTDLGGCRRPRKLPPELANRPEQLVPIRLEFDVEHHKMREVFVWNLNGGLIFKLLLSVLCNAVVQILSSPQRILRRRSSRTMRSLRLIMVSSRERFRSS